MGKTISYIELDVPFCEEVYGVSPCTAEIGVSGDEKCFNCTSTCQDLENINLVDNTVRFSNSATYVLTHSIAQGVDALPVIESIDFNPAVISLGENLGQRAVLSVTFRDVPHADTSGPFDKYVLEDGTRDYNAFEQGTFFGKLRARQPFLRGQKIRYIEGVEGQTLAQMTTRHFIVVSFDGPFPDGTAIITAHDILKKADAERAQAPVLSTGFLSDDYDDNDTSITIFPVGVGDEEYPASGYINIGGNEICSFTRSGDVFTVVRGSLGSTAQDHSASERVQLCLRFQSADSGDIIEELLRDYADIDQSYIPIDDWNAETTDYLGRLYSGTVAEPTAVNQLVSEIISQAGLAVWWDDVEQEIMLNVLKTIVTTVNTFSGETNILENSLSHELRTDQRKTAIWVYFGQRDPTKSLSDEDNYTSTVKEDDEDFDAEYGSTDIEKVFSRWIPSTGRPTAQRFANMAIARFFEPPIRFNFDLFGQPGSALPVALGGGYRIEAPQFQLPTGAPDSIPIQVTSVHPGPGIISVEAEEFRFDSRGDLVPDTVIIDLPIKNVVLRDLFDELYSEPTDETVVTLIIESGGVIGSTSTAAAALTLGSWPSGTTINITIRGFIVGKGGKGGNATGADAAKNGSVGGLALTVSRDINVFFDGGGIFSGGGGGAGGFNISGGGGGGGGGGGFDGGAGGLGNTPSGNGQPGSLTAGGAGGDASNGSGGAGGNPGFACSGALEGNASPGAAGVAVEGYSHLTITGTEDIRGSTSG